MLDCSTGGRALGSPRARALGKATLSLGPTESSPVGQGCPQVPKPEPQPNLGNRLSAGTPALGPMWATERGVLGRKG